MVTLDEFRSALLKHRSVIVKYEKILPNSSYNPTLRFDMREDGQVFEVYHYNHTAFRHCHIDDKYFKEMEMYLRTSLDVMPTPSEDVKIFNML